MAPRSWQFARSIQAVLLLDVSGQAGSLARTEGLSRSGGCTSSWEGLHFFKTLKTAQLKPGKIEIKKGKKKIVKLKQTSKGKNLPKSEVIQELTVSIEHRLGLHRGCRLRPVI